MVYMGSKANIANQIAPFIHSYMMVNGLTTYIEPFVGGANMMEKVQATERIGYDKNRYIISLFKYLQQGGELPEDVSRAQFNDCRVHFRADDGYYEDWYLAAVGYLAGFNGRFYDGSYAEPATYGDKYRDYYQERKKNILTQFKSLQDVTFEVSDYRILKPNNCLVYCDPPYANTKQYLEIEKTFNHTEFWDIMREWSKSNIVLISEENGPEDFDVIWEHDVVRSVNASDKKSVSEKLFIHSSLNMNKDIGYDF